MKFIQFRVVKKDWNKLETLGDHLIGLKKHIDGLQEFLSRKKNPELATRIDFPEELLLKKFMDIEKVFWQSPRHNHIFLPKEGLPKGIQKWRSPLSTHCS